MSSSNYPSSRGWKMIRVRASTHALFTEVQERRELARVKGQILLPHHDMVTQDDVLLYLLKKNEQDRQRRQRHQNSPAGDESKSAPLVSPAEGVYTGSPIAGDESLIMEESMWDTNVGCGDLRARPAMGITPAINRAQI